MNAGFASLKTEGFMSAPTKEVLDSLLRTAGRLGPVNYDLLELAQIHKGHISPSEVMEEYDRLVEFWARPAPQPRRSFWNWLWP
jgi:hypothetical protein